MTTSQVTLIGSAAIDTTQFNNRRLTKAGGVVVYAGYTFCKHHISTRVITCIAPSDQGLVTLFNTLGIELLAQKTPVTTRFINTYLGKEKREQHILDMANPIPVPTSDWPPPATGHVHLGPLHPDDIDERILASLQTFTGMVSLDIQGYVRSIASGRVLAGAAPILSRGLDAADIIKGDQQEWQIAMDALGSDVEGLLETYRLKEIVVTDGARGGTVIQASGAKTTYRGVPVSPITDPTGAGDVFFAAYLAERWHARHSVSISVEHAARVAARQISGAYIPSLLLEL